MIKDGLEKEITSNCVRESFAQQPNWENLHDLEAVIQKLKNLQPLVSFKDIRNLSKKLTLIQKRKAFILQAGMCAETFKGIKSGETQACIKTILDMRSILCTKLNIKIITIGRLAGQFAKPRSHNTEIRDGIELPAYRGDAINSLEFSKKGRVHDPNRLLRAYAASYSTLKLLQKLPIYSSHESLLLDYENSLIRVDRDLGKQYDTSAHFLWAGERTRSVYGDHVKFLSNISNPIGIKLGSNVSGKDALDLAFKLNPFNLPGRLSFIIRMGSKLIRDKLPHIIESIKKERINVTWISDPMHGNTFLSSSGYKTRNFHDIKDEILGFFEVHNAFNTIPGGVHIEMSGDNVTECIGGPDKVSEHELLNRYESACDPRLNRRQAIDLAYFVAKLFKK